MCARLLEKRRELDCMVARLREEEATEEQLQEVEELMAVSEREEVGRVHRRLEQLAMARIQARAGHTTHTIHITSDMV